MSLFLLTFFLLYAGMHLYAFLRAKTAIAFGTGAGIVVGLFLFLMITAPVLIRFLEKAGYEAAARIAAFAGYSWLGILFLFSSYAAAFDIYRLIVWGAGALAGKGVSAFLPSQRLIFFIPLFLSLLTFVYGFVEALNIRTEHIVIETPKAPTAAGRIRLVQISDVHLGLIIREYRLKRILEKVKEAGADILVSTGDLVDGQVCRFNGLSDLLRQINPRFGKFAITGNHEFYAGFDNSRCFTEDSGFTLLRGEAVPVAGFITIAGVDDPAAKFFGLSKNISEHELLSEVSQENFVVLLKHRPLADARAAGLYDLQISGHVHKGQIFPFSILTWLYYPHQSGFVRINDRSSLYISRGAGTWGPPIRFLSPPEIAIIDLVPPKSSTLR